MEVRPIPLWVEKGQMVEVDNHVTAVLSDIREISPRIRVFWNEQSGEFDLVEDCEDNTQRLIFSVPELDARVVSRLKAADHWHGREDPTHVLAEDEDFLAKIDADNEALEAEKDEAHREKLRDAGERLAWAGEMDRRGVNASIRVPRGPDGR